MQQNDIILNNTHTVYFANEFFGIINTDANNGQNLKNSYYKLMR